MCARSSGLTSHAQTPQAALAEQQALIQKELDKAFSRANTCRYLPSRARRLPLRAASYLSVWASAVFGFRKTVGNSRMAQREAYRRISDGGAVDFRLFAPDRWPALSRR